MTDASSIVHLAVMVALFLSLLCAVIAKDLLHSAIFLAIGSVTLGAIFFLLSSCVFISDKGQISKKLKGLPNPFGEVKNGLNILVGLRGKTN
jgi:hypothetical protein